MANNIDILDGAGSTKTVKTTDNATVHTPHHNIDTCTTVTTVSTVTSLSQFATNAINLGNGTVGTGTLRVTLASDSTGVVTLTGSLPAGTNAIGKLAANSGVDIGDVDVTSIIPGTGATNLGKAIDTATGATDTGVLALATRDDALSALTPIEGDNVQLRTDANGALWVIPSGTVTVSGAVTVTNATAANLKCEATIAAAQTIAVTNAGTFVVQENGTWVQVDDAAFTPGTSKIAMVGFQADETATDSVDEGDGGAARMTLDRKQIVTTQPHTAGGLSIFRSLDLDETEEEVKGTAGCIYKLRIANNSTSARYVKVYDGTAAGVTVGSTTPIDTIVVPGATSASQPTVITEAYGGLGITCSTGITVAATTALADADTGAPSANDVVVTVLYK